MAEKISHAPALVGPIMFTRRAIIGQEYGYAAGRKYVGNVSLYFT